jgi:2,3-diketo-5-methylthiopentyl-1-phosphate enolase
MYDPIAFTIPEGIDYGEYLVATYLYRTSAKANIHKLALAISEVQSSGSWVSLPGENSAVRKRHAGRILAIWETPDYEIEVPESVNERNWIIQIGYPLHNFGPQIPLMLTTVYGEISATGKLKLLDLHFPRAYIEQFKGPKFGIEGTRKLLGVYDRPLLLSMIKPPLGLTPEQSANALYQASVGGVDAIKDDELIVSHPWSHFLERVRLHKLAAEKSFAETGQKTLYFVNITDRPDRLIENAKQAVEAGASALMVNYLVVGISALSILADSPDINVPILAHLNFSGALYAAPWSGLSSHLVLGKLPRLAGADVVVYPSPYGKLPLLQAKHLRIAQSLNSSFYNITRAWPSPGGGVHPGMVHLLYSDMAKDCMIGAGGAIHGHPMGPTAGGRAFRQAVDAVINNIPIEEAAEQFPELKTALKVWGVVKVGIQGNYDLMDN